VFAQRRALYNFFERQEKTQIWIVTFFDEYNKKHIKPIQRKKRTRKKLDL